MGPDSTFGGVVQGTARQTRPFPIQGLTVPGSREGRESSSGVSGMEDRGGEKDRGPLLEG